MVMLVPLMILAVLSLVGGFVGLGNHFEHFLTPVFGAPEAAEAASHGTELLLMGVSVGVALFGWLLAYVLYCSGPNFRRRSLTRSAVFIKRLCTSITSTNFMLRSS